MTLALAEIMITTCAIESVRMASTYTSYSFEMDWDECDLELCWIGR